MLAMVAVVSAYVPIWSSDHRDSLWKLPVILYVVATAIAYTLLLASRQRIGASGKVRVTFAIALVSIFALAGVIIDIVVRMDVRRGEWQVLGTVAVLTVSMTLITLLLRRLDAVSPSGASKKPRPLVGRRIAIVEDGDLGTILVLDDGRRLLLDPGAKLEQ